VINSRKIEDLDPEVQKICLQHLANAREEGIELIVTSTWRDYEAQDGLYAIGRTVDVERRPVTNARGGSSWHNFKAAYDVVPIVHGKPVWEAADPIWKEVVELGKAAGAEAGADWPHFRDMPHFQVRPGTEGLQITMAEAKARFDEHGTVFIV
jgi:peptidoglycan LD-endopeptidase CwlK